MYTAENSAIWDKYFCAWLDTLNLTNSEYDNAYMNWWEMYKSLAIENM